MDNIEDEAIIEAVKLHKAIYDRSKNTNRKAIDVLWKRIAEELGGDVENLKYRWCYLRDTFVKKHRILQKKEAGILKKQVTKWPLYEKMDFFIPYMKSPRNPSLKNISHPLRNQPNNNSPVKKTEQMETVNWCPESPISNCDDSEHFLRSILPILKKLDPITKLEFRLEVQQLLLHFARQAELCSTDAEPNTKIIVNTQTETEYAVESLDGNFENS
ncbi:transcription factor Adf-1-like isoform X2 [Palaemon carinicauda]|uniref:transcription factor Adf-1-like isoform X2 n=1 Tax=Palaemon carinicauda TaxID=392227 RepID=UPI0035B59FEC